MNLNLNRNTPLFILRKLLAFFLIYAIADVGQQLILTGIFFVCGYDPVNGIMPDEKYVTVVLYLGFVVYAALAVGYCSLIEKRSLKTMGISRHFSGYLPGMIVACVLLGIILGVCCLAGGMRFGGYNEKPEWGYLIALAVGFFVQGAAEEILCRGFLMTSLMKKVSIPMAIFVSSTAFVVPHLGTLMMADLPYAVIGVINLYLISAIFSILMLGKNSIWISCGLHSTWNFLLSGVFGLTLSGNEENGDVFLHFEVLQSSLINGGVYGIEASLVTTVVLTLALLLIGSQHKNRRGEDGI